MSVQEITGDEFSSTDRIVMIQNVFVSPISINFSIRSKKTANVKKLMPLLELEGVFVTENQVEWVFTTHNIKKNDSHWSS